VSLTKLFCIQKVVKAKADEAAKYPTIHKEAVSKSPKGSGSHELALGFVPLDNPASGRHPDCPLGPSLVFSRIAPTSQASTYRHRGEDFAGKISADLLFLDIRDAGDVLVRASDQLSFSHDYLALTNQRPSPQPPGHSEGTR
jgi:hypothetical protein